jgi:hypothetical protein
MSEVKEITNKRAIQDQHKIIAEKIQIIGIKTLKGSIDADETAGEHQVQAHLFNFEVGTGVNLAEKIMGVQLLVNIDGIGKDGKLVNIKGSYTHEITFRVDNLQDFVVSEEEAEEPEIHWLMSSTLASIAYSTVRGIIYNRTIGTSLDAVILPVIGPQTLIDMKEKKE